MLDSFISSKLLSLKVPSKDHFLLIQYYNRRKHKLTLLILNKSISSKRFSPEVQ
jgi:hypothetical protein